MMLHESGRFGTDRSGAESAARIQGRPGRAARRCTGARCRRDRSRALHSRVRTPRPTLVSDRSRARPDRHAAAVRRENHSSAADGGSWHAVPLQRGHDRARPPRRDRGRARGSTPFLDERVFRSRWGCAIRGSGRRRTSAIGPRPRISPRQAVGWPRSKSKAEAPFTERLGAARRRRWPRLATVPEQIDQLRARPHQLLAGSGDDASPLPFARRSTPMDRAIEPAAIGSRPTPHVAPIRFDVTPPRPYISA